MTPTEIAQALETHMATWTDYPIAYDGAPAGPAVEAAQANNTPWIRFTMQPSATVNASITDKPCPRRAGLLFMQIFTDRNIGSRPAKIVASSLVEHWENITLGNIRLLEATEQYSGPDDNYYQLNLTVPYRAD